MSRPRLLRVTSEKNFLQLGSLFTVVSLFFFKFANRHLIMMTMMMMWQASGLSKRAEENCAHCQCEEVRNIINYHLRKVGCTKQRQKVVRPWMAVEGSIGQIIIVIIINHVIVIVIVVSVCLSFTNETTVC